MEQYENKIFTPFFPSLFHITNVTIALPLFKKYIIQASITELVQGVSKVSEKEKLIELQEEIAGEYLQFVSNHLKDRIWNSFYGLDIELKRWQADHSMIFKLDDEKCIHSIHWRSDGTIDTLKTAQQLILDESIDIRKRFEVACMYCLDRSVKTLWAEMEASGKANEFVPTERSTASFWIRWMLDGSCIHWAKIIPNYLEPFQRWNVRFSQFFPFLEHKDRGVFLSSLQCATFDDLRFCLYSMNIKEQEEMLVIDSCKLFLLHLHWPLDSQFLEIITKTRNFIDSNVFRFLLLAISRRNETCKDSASLELFLDFWNVSLDHLKESAKENSNSKWLIDSLFDCIGSYKLKILKG